MKIWRNLKFSTPKFINQMSMHNPRLNGVFRNLLSSFLPSFYLYRNCFLFSSCTTLNHSCTYSGTNNFDKALSKERRRLKRRGDPKEKVRWYSENLRDCSLKGCYSVGKAIHGRIIVNQAEPDVHLWNNLLNFYVKSGNLKSAVYLFDKILDRDVVSWTTLITGYVNGWFGNKGMEMFSEMRKEDVKANDFAYTTVLKACSLCFELHFGKQVHGELVKVGCLSDFFVGCALIDVYAKCNEIGYAESIFRSMPEKNDVSWNVLLNAYADACNLEKVVKLFSEMTDAKMKYSSFTLSIISKCCANSKNLRAGQVIHSFVIKMDHVVDNILGSGLVDMYSKCGLEDAAFEVFKRIKVPNNVTWSALISCFDSHGKSSKASEHFGLMMQAGVKADQFTLASLVCAATHLVDKGYAESIHGLVFKSGFGDHNLVSNALVSMYLKFGDVQNGCLVFETLINPDLDSWNALLSGLRDNENYDKGLKIFEQMLADGFQPNMHTFVSILKYCSALSFKGLGKQVHAHIVKNMMNSDDFVQRALMDMYAKTNLLDDVEIVFTRLLEKDPISWNVIISGFVHSNQTEKAIKYLRQMQKDDVRPNEFIIASCLSGCSRITTLEGGRQLHSVSIKTGLMDAMHVASSVVDMYGKCGCVGDAETAFRVCPAQNTSLWSSIICCYAQHGLGHKSLDTFRCMLVEGITPNAVTLLGVLSACSYRGLIDEGKEQFEALSNIYSINPTIEHYACMFDILGRAGRFDELKNFVQKMKIPATPLIWKTILGACSLHGNLELGQIAAEKLFELEPKMNSTSILLSNIFASKGMWDDARKVRASMSRHGIKKEPGWSWVEVENQVHVFLSRDSSHPLIGQIHVKLEELNQELTSMGYNPKTEFALHNVTDAERKDNLTYHSGRLALAFSLICSRSSRPIRIFKNHRICGDCHDVMKLSSDITKREIVVRDAKRFHHFQNGKCSCQDYW